MKIAVSSSAFASAFVTGTTTQLEWLDLCANELEVDGVVFDAGDFPRADDDYLAQIKKSATDLGLTVAAVSRAATLPSDADLALALALGAPIAIGYAPAATDDPEAWNAFASAAKTCARAAKKVGVVVALANAPGTLCADAAGLRRIAYDVDGSWLRFSLEIAPSANSGEFGPLLAKTVIARLPIADTATFATESDARAHSAIETLARFRGFIVLEGTADARTSVYHDAIARFGSARSRFLEDRARNVVKT